MIKYKTYQAYYDAQTPIAKESLKTFQSLIVESIPFYRENMKYGVPCFDLKEDANHDDILMLSCYKNHISFYPRIESIEVYRDELVEYKVLKGTIQIKYGQEINKKLFAKILKHSFDIVQ